MEFHRHEPRSESHFRRLFAAIRAYLDDLDAGRFVFRSCIDLEIGYSDPKTRGNCEAGQSAESQDRPSMARPGCPPEMPQRLENGCTENPPVDGFSGF
jgi:hypothetical protein